MPKSVPFIKYIKVIIDKIKNLPEPLENLQTTKKPHISVKL